MSNSSLRQAEAITPLQRRRQARGGRRARRGGSIALPSAPRRPLALSHAMPSRRAADYFDEKRIINILSIQNIHRDISLHIIPNTEVYLGHDLTVCAIYASSNLQGHAAARMEKDRRKLRVAEPKQRFSHSRMLAGWRSPRSGPARGKGVSRKAWDQPSAHRIKIALLALGVFVLDTVTEIDIVIPVLYVNVVLFAMRSGRASDIAIAGSASVALTIVSLALTIRPEVSAATALFNTALSLLAILCVTILCLRSVRSTEEILRARNRIAFLSRGIFLRALSSSVAHQVTKPIAAIGADAEAACRSLSSTPPDLDETKAATRRIVEDVERLSAVIGRLRGSMAPREVAYEICGARALIESAIEHLRFDLGDAGIGVTLVCPPDLRVVADKVLIEQVIVHAITNAIEALRTTTSDRRLILVETKALPGAVQILIEDNGGGVDTAALERIFEPFFTTKAASGTGVGLAVSKSIVEIHDGTIRALPHLPNGLTIEITLPAAQTDLA